MRNVSQADTYCLRATGGAVTVTLAWADYPCDLSAAICLVRNHRCAVFMGCTRGSAQPWHAAICQCCLTKRVVCAWIVWLHHDSSGYRMCLGWPPYC